MIRAERLEGHIIETEIQGSGEQVLAEFGSLCGTIVNNMVDVADIPEEKAVEVLAKVMASGVSQRENHEDTV